MNNRRSLYIAGAIAALVIIFCIVSYNSLVKKDEKVKKQWNEVQSAYQRRLDLVPNLVTVVKGAADFEHTTLDKVTEARAKAGSVTFSADSISSDNYQKQTAAQNELAAAANNLMIRVENYPTLKGTEAFAGLQAQLEGTERRIKFSRKDFNDAIQDYNSSVRRFPTKIVAGLFGFKTKEGFQADAGTDQAVEIKF